MPPPPHDTTNTRTILHHFAGYSFIIKTDAEKSSKRLRVKRAYNHVEYYCSGVLLTKIKYKFERDIFSLHEDPDTDPLKDVELCKKIEILIGPIVAGLFPEPWTSEEFDFTWGVRRCEKGIGDGNFFFVDVANDADSLPMHDSLTRHDSSSRQSAHRSIDRTQLVGVLRKIELLTAIELTRHRHLTGSAVASVIGRKDPVLATRCCSNPFRTEVPSLLGLLVSKLKCLSKFPFQPSTELSSEPPKRKHGDGVQLVEVKVPDESETFSKRSSIRNSLSSNSKKTSVTVPYIPNLRADSKARAKAQDEDGISWDGHSQSSYDDPFSPKRSSLSSNYDITWDGHSQSSNDDPFSPKRSSLSSNYDITRAGHSPSYNDDPFSPKQSSLSSNPKKMSVSVPEIPSLSDPSRARFSLQDEDDITSYGQSLMRTDYPFSHYLDIGSEGDDEGGSNRESQASKGDLNANLNNSNGEEGHIAGGISSSGEEQIIERRREDVDLTTQSFRDEERADTEIVPGHVSGDTSLDKLSTLRQPGDVEPKSKPEKKVRFAVPSSEQSKSGDEIDRSKIEGEGRDDEINEGACACFGTAYPNYHLPTNSFMPYYSSSKSSSAIRSVEKPYQEAVAAGHIYDISYASEGHLGWQRGISPPPHSNGGSEHDSVRPTKWSPGHNSAVSDLGPLPPPATSSRHSGRFSREISDERTTDADLSSEDSGTLSSQPRKKTLLLLLAKDTLSLTLGVIVLTLSILTIVLDPAGEENWFKRIEEGGFVMLSFGIPLLVAMRERVTHNLHIKMPALKRKVRSMQDLERLNNVTDREAFLTQLQRELLFNEELSMLFSAQNACYKLSRKSGNLVIPEKATYTGVFAKVWVFGEEHAYNKILGKAFRYEERDNMLMIENESADVEGVIVHVRRRMKRYTFGSNPEP